MNNFNSKKTKISYRINDDIIFNGNVRIIGDDIDSKVVSINEARKIANSLNLDLVEYNSKINPPIYKICKYDKFIYEQKKQAKKNKSSNLPIKEIQLSVNIAPHDLETKAKQAIKFLTDGHKVRVILTMRGRELIRKEDNKKSLLEFIVRLEDYAALDSNIIDNGNKTSVLLKKR